MRVSFIAMKSKICVDPWSGPYLGNLNEQFTCINMYMHV